MPRGDKSVTFSQLPVRDDVTTSRTSLGVSRGRGVGYLLPRQSTDLRRSEDVLSPDRITRFASNRRAQERETPARVPQMYSTSMSAVTNLDRSAGERGSGRRSRHDQTPRSFVARRRDMYETQGDKQTPVDTRTPDTRTPDIRTPDSVKSLPNGTTVPNTLQPDPHTPGDPQFPDPHTPGVPQSPNSPTHLGSALQSPSHSIHSSASTPLPSSSPLPSTLSTPLCASTPGPVPTTPNSAPPLVVRGGSRGSLLSRLKRRHRQSQEVSDSRESLDSNATSGTARTVDVASVERRKLNPLQRLRNWHKSRSRSRTRADPPSISLPLARNDRAWEENTATWPRNKHSAVTPGLTTGLSTGGGPEAFNLTSPSAVSASEITQRDTRVSSNGNLASNGTTPTATPTNGTTPTATPTNGTTPTAAPTNGTTPTNGTDVRDRSIVFSKPQTRLELNSSSEARVTEDKQTPKYTPLEPAPTVSASTEPSPAYLKLACAAGGYSSYSRYSLDSPGTTVGLSPVVRLLAPTPYRPASVDSTSTDTQTAAADTRTPPADTRTPPADTRTPPADTRTRGPDTLNTCSQCLTLVVQCTKHRTGDSRSFDKDEQRRQTDRSADGHTDRSADRHTETSGAEMGVSLTKSCRGPAAVPDSPTEEAPPIKHTNGHTDTPRSADSGHVTVSSRSSLSSEGVSSQGGISYNSTQPHGDTTAAGVVTSTRTDPTQPHGDTSATGVVTSTRIDPTQPQGDTSAAGGVTSTRIDPTQPHGDTSATGVVTSTRTDATQPPANLTSQTSEGSTDLTHTSDRLTSSAAASDEATSASIQSCNSVTQPNTAVDNSTNDTTDQPTERAGYKFLALLNDDIRRMTDLCDDAAGYKPDNDEACGKVRAAVGMAQLLMKQKLTQFRQLCDKNISDLPGCALPTTADDLSGFWDMVSIQVSAVYTAFDEIHELKRNRWRVVKPAATRESSASSRGSKTPRRKVKDSSKQSAEAKRRAEAKQRLMAAKRAARQQRTNSQSDDSFCAL